MSRPCPICTDQPTHPVDEVDAAALARAYREQFGIAIAAPPAPRLELNACPRCGLRSFHPVWTGDAALYDQLQEHPWYYLAEKEEYTIAARFVGPDDRVLEVGSGEGRFAAHLRAASYVGLEFSARAIERARDRGLDLRRQSIEDHAAGHPGHYDTVCHFQVLEHVGDPAGFLRACARCLRPGGRMLVSVPNDDSFMGAEANNLLNLPPHHVTRWNETALRHAGVSVGLRVVAVEFERLSDLHVRSYARCVAQAALRRWLRRPHRVLDAFFRNPVVRAVVWPLSLPVEAALAAESSLRPVGHSVVMVFEKP